MHRLGTLTLILVVAAAPAVARHDTGGCGTTAETPGVVSAGDFIEIYCTGLGATLTGANGLEVTVVTPTVYFGATQVTPVYSGLAPGFTGLYQVDVQAPAGLHASPVPLVIASGAAYSNQVNITVQ
jgi:uncharacterized protein (TIGR03437 family)